VYVEAELKLACEQFRIQYTGELKQEYRDFEDSRWSGVPGRKSELSEICGNRMVFACFWHP